jgi:hypothetical protein
MGPGSLLHQVYRFAELKAFAAVVERGGFRASGYLSVDLLNSDLLRLRKVKFPSAPSQIACL